MAFLTGLTVAMQGVSLVSGLIGGQMEAEAEAQAFEERRRTDLFNAKVAEQEARSEIETAGAEASDFRRAQSARVAASRARAAGSGFALEGSPLLVDEAALAEIEFGAQRIVHSGQTRAARLRQESTLLTRSAEVEGINARLARRAGTIKSLGRAARGVVGIGETLSTRGVQFG